MKSIITQYSATAFSVGLLLASGIAAEAAFNSGSLGTYGSINVTSNTTLELPPSGIFHCTTITVGQGFTLRFKRNALNTPVYLLATGDVLISGSINVEGANNGGAIAGVGGPGGFDGGFGGFGASAPGNRGGDGHGPGRGVNQTGLNFAAYAQAAGFNTNTYGNVLIVPMIGGSGGAGGNGNPGNGGGGGGGAILIASNTRITVNGNIIADGGSGAGYGSGGSIRLAAPTGGGTGGLYSRGESSASDGRIRIDTEENTAFRNLSLLGSSTRGTQMFVFPASTPKLHIVHAAGQNIPVGTSAAVNVLLTAGSPTSQTVRLLGEGFTGNVAVQVVVNPEHSASTLHNLTLNGSANPPEVSTTITLPIGEQTRIEAWVR